MPVSKLKAEDFDAAKKQLKENFKSFEILDVACKRNWALKNFGKPYYEIAYYYKDNNDSNLNVCSGLNKDIFEKVNHMENLLNEISSKVGGLSKQVEEKGDIFSYFSGILVNNGVEMNVAKSIVKETINSLPTNKRDDSSVILLKLAEKIKNTINTSGGYNFEKDKTIMLVGPTGVGKTTTLAKLSGLLYHMQKDIGIVTLDTYRLGAAEQLKEFADIMKAPLEICSNAAEVQEAFKKFMDKEHILIDTTGRNQKSAGDGDIAKEVADILDVDKLSLVVSATTKTEDLYDCLERYNSYHTNSLIFTKMDETNDYGNILNVAYKFKNYKLEYFTDGQNVPQDIKEAKPEKIIMGLMKVDDQEESLKKKSSRAD